LIDATVLTRLEKPHGLQTRDGSQRDGYGGAGSLARRGGRRAAAAESAFEENTTHQLRTVASSYFRLLTPEPHLCLGSSIDIKMRSIPLLSSCLAALSSFAAAELNLSQPLLSKQVLPSTFKPPQVFKNVNLVRNTNLDKGYPRETINVVIENIDSKPQSEYYLPFESTLLSRVGGLEVRDKKDAEKGAFKVEVVGYDAER
jgi:hypothetical protein